MKKIRNVLLSMAMIFIVVLSTACSSKEAATATKTYVLENNYSLYLYWKGRQSCKANN